MSILENIGAGIVSVAIAIAGFFGYTPEPVYAPVEEPLGADTQSFFGGQTYTLAGTGISSSASSFTLTSFTIPQNGKKIQDSEMSDTFYGTFEPGSRARQEFFSCTTVVQNSDNTATISGCTRGLSPVTPYTASTSLQFAHGGGTSVIFSNTPQFYDQFAAKGNDETITGQWTFLNFPITASSSPATATTTGTVELATGAEAASSTLSGDITASKLALHTGIATSAAPTSGNVVVVTQDDGDIDPNFISNVTGSTTVRYITASSSWSKPTSPTLRSIDVELIGGGGGGGGITSDAPTNGGRSAGGGSAGGYCKINLNAAELSGTTSVFVNIGRAGLGGSVNAENGSSTIFGNFATSSGGLGGFSGDGASDAVAGGTGTGCDFTFPGGSGGPTSGESFGVGRGGDSFYGRGGQTFETTGGSATGYGAGGGGAGVRVGNTTNGTGGNGSAGIVIITEYY